MKSLIARRFSFSLLATLAAVLMLPAFAAAATLTVNDDTTGPGPVGANCAAPDKTTIQNAIDDPALNDAAPDTVLVCAGVYGGGADGVPVATAYRPGLDLIGARAGQDARTRPSGSESLLSDPDGGIAATVNDITIDGFDIRDAQQTYFAGIWLSGGTSNHRVINNVLRDNGEGLSLANGSAGQTVVRFNFLDANNEVFGNGISADTATQNVLIDRNRFRDHQNAGVIFQSTSPSHGFNNDVQIVNNQFENTNPDDLFNNNRLILLSTDDALIQGNTFTNNVTNAIQLLGANQNVDVIGNTVLGAGFSAVRIRACTVTDCGADWDPNSNVGVLGNTLVGSHETGNDAAAINIADGGYAGTLQAHFNRIAGNDRGIELDDSGELVDAQNNWWGCNGGPSASACDKILGVGAPGVDATPWLVLGASANPGMIPVGGSSTVTASLAQNSAGESPGGNLFPAGTAIGFATDLGTIGGAALTASPIATNVFQAGSIPGTATVSESLDSQTVSTPVDIISTGGLAQISSSRCERRKTGDSGNDFLSGTSEGDRMKGKGGNDNLRGKAGNDCLSGGTENDRLNGGSGEDLLKGGAGDDVINAKDGEPDKVRCGFGIDRATVDPTDTVKACEIVS